MKNDKPVTVYRNDYTVFDYIIECLTLNFQIYEEKTRVTATGKYRRNSLSLRENPSLVLFGEELEIVSVRLDGKEMAGADYYVNDKMLRLENVPPAFSLEIVTTIYPDRNTSLEGLYRSGAKYCTQCEAEGFRKITYYPDRPDVLTRFTTRIEADKTSCPVLLANGNCREKGELDATRHYAVWEDPFPKPCYLFALVAGRLVSIEDEYITRSGRRVELKIFVEEQNKNKCNHAMTALKKAMHWDEEVFGLEYDLDIYMIVAVDDFNMGAMENKGLNIFNSKYVLSSPETATDQDYLGIEGVIAHEYFHNWTGNRVTCRDWFQLSLKEGLTVFRDQEFSADMNSRPVQRIDDVRVLKNFQFKEDAGPMAHPVRPDSYVEINNFYTSTVYNKGAEVIRMMNTILGAAKFREGMDLYFARHDGQAVTCDDFVAAMSDASGVDLSQFQNWYIQAGTPILQVEGEWNEEHRQYLLTVRQNCPDTPGQTEKRPFHMPLSVGLLGSDGQDLLTHEQEGTAVLQLHEQEQLFTFKDIKEKPVVSFLRDFSAPVRVASFQSRAELAFLLRYDTNLYNRWDAATRLAGEVILEAAEKLTRQEIPLLDELYLDAVAHSIQHDTEDPEILALSLTLPAETTLAQEMAIIDPDALHQARRLVKKELAERNRDALTLLYEKNRVRGEYRITPADIGKRSLKNVALSYLMALDPLPDEILDLCYAQYRDATNMTDNIAAVANVVDLDRGIRKEVLEDFYAKWVGDPLVLDKWFTLQALSILPTTLKEVRQLVKNPSFSINNPNRVRALIGAFCTGNHVCFHDKSGVGYGFLADMITELNSINPQIAARLVSPLINWKRYDVQRQSLMKQELNRIASVKNLSRDVYEVVNKSR
ncbi:MAG: aminopeptidase N [Desulfobulbaceae bacterium BRH_c16a]|nr:MAG: aminopeptidase N [Desulfobulbaceae bacterium BRH_c16a]